MGFLTKLAGGIAAEGLRGTFEGIGSLAKDLRSAITGEISPEKKAEIEQKVLEIEAQSKLGQLEINRQEAAHPSVFVSGWRPAIGWVCAISLGSFFIPKHIMAAILWTKAAWIAQSLPPYPIDAKGILELTGGMLGLALWRTLEKRSGVARN